MAGVQRSESALAVCNVRREAFAFTMSGTMRIFFTPDFLKSREINS
jgi:hypothetical protein